MSRRSDQLEMDVPSRLWWDSPIVQQWIREGSVCPPVYLPEFVPSEEECGE